MNRQTLAFVGCMVLGAIVWIAVSAASGRTEAWDSPAYLTIAIPVVCVAAFALGYLIPVRSWRWGLGPVIGQFVALLVTQGVGNLLPLGLIVFAILSVPSIITAHIGAALATRRTR